MPPSASFVVLMCSPCVPPSERLSQPFSNWSFERVAVFVFDSLASVLGDLVGALTRSRAGKNQREKVAPLRRARPLIIWRRIVSTSPLAYPAFLPSARS